MFTKILGFLIITLVSMVIAFWPEALMYFSWNLINPQTDLTRVILLVAFWFGGAGLSIAFLSIGVMLWAHMVKEL